MKRRLTVSKLLIVMGVCLSSSVYGGNWSVVNGNETAGPNAQFDKVTIQSNNGKASTLYVNKGSSLKAGEVVIYSEASGKGANLLITDGSFTATSIRMTGAGYGADQIDANLSFDGGVSSVGSIYAEGNAYLSINGGRTTFGNVYLGRGSNFSAGFTGTGIATKQAKMTLNGSIVVDSITIGANLSSISLGNALLQQNNGGVVTVFQYESVSADYGLINGIPDTLTNAKTLLDAAIKEYKSSSDKLYDLSEAKVVINYYGSGENKAEGPGSISITGVKPIPEPSSATLGLLGLSALLLRRKRRA